MTVSATYSYHLYSVWIIGILFYTYEGCGCDGCLSFSHVTLNGRTWFTIICFTCEKFSFTGLFSTCFVVVVFFFLFAETFTTFLHLFNGFLFFSFRFVVYCVLRRPQTHEYKMLLSHQLAFSFDTCTTFIMALAKADFYWKRSTVMAIFEVFLFWYHANNIVCV